jgi:hypothetical protein
MQIAFLYYKVLMSFMTYLERGEIGRGGVGRAEE